MSWHQFVQISFLALPCLVVTQAASAATIALDTFSSFVWSGASDSLASETLNTEFPLALPSTDTINAINGGSESTTVFSLSNSGFDFTFDHERTSNSDAYADTGLNIVFTPDENVPYVLSGVYSANDSEGRTVYFRASLQDLTTSAFQFDISELSQATPNENLTLGSPDAEFNTITGSLTGTLIAGNTYRFFAQAQISSYPNGATAGAQATGHITLSLVPEPATALLLGMGLIGLASIGRPGGGRASER